MTRRIAIFAFGCLSYLVFLATFLYALGFVGGFLGSPPMNFIELPIVDGAATLDGFRTPAPGRDRIVAGIRAEDVSVAEDGLPFDVRVAEPLGATLLLTGQVAGQLMRVAARPDARVKAGDRIHLRPDPARIVWIDPKTDRAAA